MIREYIVPELCEQYLGGIDKDTFRRNKAHYMNELQNKGDVEETDRKRGRYTIYTFEPKNREMTAKEKADEEFLNIIGCEIGDKDIRLLKFILKSILEQKIVPVHEEITHYANLAGILKTRGTVGNYIAFLEDNHIIVKPMQIPVWVDNPVIRRDGTEIYLKRKFDSETGEVFPTYYKKIVKHVYFDYAKDDVCTRRKRVSKVTQEAIEMAFNNLWPEVMEMKIYPLYNQNHGYKYIEHERQKAQANLIREIGSAYGMRSCVRIEEPIISSSVKQRLKEYFSKAD